MNFIIYLHNQISLENGGMIVQLNLAKSLTDRGYLTRLISPFGNKENAIFNIFGDKNDVNDDTIAIYSDGIEGNPLNAKRVVRWILYGIWNSVTRTFSDTDTIYYHLPFCKLNKTTNFLSFHYVDPGSFNKGLNRYRESCYIMKKGIYYKKNNPSRKLCRLTNNNLLSFRNQVVNNVLSIEYLSLEETIQVFNTTKYFFCYDPVCFLVVIAIMCGCIVIQDPMSGYTEEEYLYTTLRLNERLKGFAYGIENLPFAISTIHEAPDQCRRLVERNNSSIDTFIQQMKDKTYSTERCYDFDSSPYSFQHGYFNNKVMNNNVGIY